MPPEPQPPAFLLFGPAHLGTLLGIVLVAAVLVRLARGGNHPHLLRVCELGLAGSLLLTQPAEAAVSLMWGGATLENFLPLHLCDVAALAGATALVFHWRQGGELLYFWGLAGTLNGAITPALKFDFPHPAFLAFFLLHGGVIVAAIYWVAGRRQWPQPGAVTRAMLWSTAYVTLAGTVNWLSGTNFGFLAHKPDTASLFDVLGPWPWYVAVLFLVATALFSLLYLPFVLLRRKTAAGA